MALHAARTRAAVEVLDTETVTAFLRELLMLGAGRSENLSRCPGPLALRVSSSSKSSTLRIAAELLSGSACALREEQRCVSRFSRAATSNVEIARAIHGSVHARRGRR